MMMRRWRGRGGTKGDMQDSIVVEEGMMSKFPLVNLTTMSPSPAAPALRFFLQGRSKTATT